MISSGMIYQCIFKHLHREMTGSSSWFSIFVFVFLISPCAYSLSFNFSSIDATQGKNFNFQGDAYVSTEGIQVTSDERSKVAGNSTGRATYFEPLLLWDKVSGNLTDFYTHFSFVLDSTGGNCSGDGLSFFLAPVNSKIPTGSGGGGLGLINATSNKPDHNFVAVEFDTFSNPGEPTNPDTHVGVDISSVRSEPQVPWYNNITGGKKNDAWITYNANTKLLSVQFTGFWNNSNYKGKLEHMIDLRNYLPENVSIGFSATTGYCFEKNTVKSWEFSSSLQLMTDLTANSKENATNGGPPVTIPGPNPPKNKTGLVVLLVVAGCFLVACSGLLLLVIRRRNTRNNSEDNPDADTRIDDELERDAGPKKFSYKELQRATDNFAEEEKLGEGGFGGVYRGSLPQSNSLVAVKRVSKGSKQGTKEFVSEVRIISSLRHKNLVQLLGWCHEKGELLLVYEFMSNGSLDYHLFGGKSLLTWPIRYKIAQGLGSALLYLHEEWEKCVVHRDIKSSNVMLDLNFNAKLGDFGLARLVDHDNGPQTTVLAGTIGYMAPECHITGKASKETDVYSFGIVALEIACGRKPIDPQAKKGQVHIVEWVWSLYGMGKLHEAADPTLSGDFDQQQIERLMVVGLWCACLDSDLRPPIREAIRVLNSEASLPDLPSTMPLPKFGLTTATSSSISSLYTNKDDVSDSSSQVQSSAYSSSTNSSQFTAAASSEAVSLLYKR